MKIRITGIFLSIALIFCGCASSAESRPLHRTGFYFDTAVDITLYGGSEELLDEAFSLCSKYEKIFSAALPDSELYNLNGAGGGEVSGELLDLLQKAVYYSELSGGKFDVTTAAYSRLWDFSGDNNTVPDSVSLSAAGEKVGYTNIVIDGNLVSLKNGAEIDFGGIAKGYIADRLAELLESSGVSGAVISLGGNICLYGDKGNGEEYTVGIKNPQNTAQIAATLKIGGDISVVTSGDYERCFEKDGVLYHHILDSSTGMPAESDLHSATVICKSSADADALSTICFLLGSDEGLRLIEGIPDTEAVFIDKKGDIICTSGIGDSNGRINIEY